MDADDTIIAGGAQACDPHQRGEGPLKTGEFIVCDIFPKSLESGFWGDMTRTFFHGALRPEQRKQYAAVQAAHDAVIAALRAGVSGAAMHKLAADTMRAAGFEDGENADGTARGFIHSTGHGVGLEIHEEPRLSPSGGVLRAGMVVTVEPGLYYPELGGVRIEDTVAVREDRAQVL
jgi:Xaa-Pro aminopeptidase